MKSFNFRFKKENIILLFFIILTSLVKAQNFSWAGQLSSTSTVSINGIKVDAAGNAIVLLRLYSGTIDCDPSAGVYNLTSSGINDIVFCKYDNQGNFIWAKQIGGVGDDVGYNLTLDSLGNIYFCGRSDNTVDFDPGPGIYNLTNVTGFVLKLDSSGNLIWVKPYQVTISQFKIDNNGNILISDAFSGTQDFDPGIGVFNMTTVGILDVYVAKLDASGNFLWAGQIGGVQLDNVFSMDIDNSGNLYLTGIFNFNADFDPGPGQYYLTSLGNTDVFVEKINSNGTFAWAYRLGEVDYDYGHNIKYDPSGYIYASGYFKDTVDFDPGPGIFNQVSISSYNMYLTKLDLSGNLVWAKQFSCATSISESNDATVLIDAQNDINIGGKFSGTVDFDPGAGITNLSSIGSYDIFICKLNSNGDLLGLTTIESSNNEGTYCMDMDDQNNSYLAGYFTGTLDFDPGPGVFNLTPSGSGNSQFIMKTGIAAVGINHINSNRLLSIFPNPTQGNVRIEFSNSFNEPFSATLSNVFGEKLKVFELNQTSTELQLDVSAGIYFLTLQNSKQSLTQKIILQ